MKKKRGRPRKEAGTKVQDLPAFTVRLAPLVKERLRAISHLTQQSMSDVIAEAVDLYLAKLPAKDRAHIAFQAARRAE